MNLPFTETPIEDGLQHAVTSLFKRTEFKTLKRIIETQGQKHATAAANAALKSGEFPNYTDAANEELRKAIRYQTVLDVLKELEDQKEKFTTVKPSTPA